MNFNLFEDLEKINEGIEDLPVIKQYTPEEAKAIIEADPDLKAEYERLLPAYEDSMIDEGDTYCNFHNAFDLEDNQIVLQWMAEDDDFIVHQVVVDSLEQAIVMVADINKAHGKFRGIEIYDMQEDRYLEPGELLSNTDTDEFTEDFADPTIEVLEDIDDWDAEDELIPPQIDDAGIARICQSLYADDKSAVAFVKDDIWDEDGNRLEFTDWVYNLCDAFQLNCGIKTSTQIYNAILKDKRFMGMLRNDFDDLNAQ